MNSFLVVLMIVLILLIGVVIAGIVAYNGLVRSRNVIQESWRQVDVELQRRSELIPNLVETVRAFASHERNTLEDVTRLRNQAAALQSGGGDVPTAERAQVEDQLSGAVRNLMVSVESYPELRSNTNFLDLQRQLGETEDRIAAGRRYYNANVRVYNTKIESVPTNIIAGVGKFQRATYFEVTDPAARRSPEVNFGEIAYRGEDPAGRTNPGAAPAQPALGSQAPAPAADQLPDPQREAAPQPEPYPPYRPGDQSGRPGGDPVR